GAVAIRRNAGAKPVVLALRNKNADGAMQAFDALSGEVFGSVHNTQAGEAQFPRGGMLGRMRQMTHAGTPGPFGALAFAGPQLAYASGDQHAAYPVKSAPGASARPRDL